MSYLTAKERRHQQRVDARRAILDATQELLDAEGYESFSIRRLANRCGYTAPTIYRHFGDKGGLLDAVIEERFRGLLDIVRRIPAEADPLDVIRARARAFIRFSLDNPTEYRLLTQLRDPDRTPTPSAEETRALLEQPWLALIQQGRLDATKLDVAQQSSIALLHGLIAMRMNRPDLPWSPALIDESIDALLRGWVAPPVPQLAHAAPRTRKGIGRTS